MTLEHSERLCDQNPSARWMVREDARECDDRYFCEKKIKIKEKKG